MADRIQARAIRRCGELLKQVEADKGGYHKNYAHDSADTSITRTSVAREAGMSERQKVAGLRVANVPEPVFNQAVESETPPTVTQLVAIVWRLVRSPESLPLTASSNPILPLTSSLPTSIAVTSIKASRQWLRLWRIQRQRGGEAISIPQNRYSVPILAAPM